MPTELQTELAALREGAAIVPLGDRAFLRIAGPDATRWLNGMVTNNITGLAPGEGNYNFLLNSQGRIQGDCTIYREPMTSKPTFVLETDITQLDPIHQHLDKFIIMDDVELAPGLNIDGSRVESSPRGLALLGAQANVLFTKVLTGRHEVALDRPPDTGTMTLGSLEGHEVVILTPPTSTVPIYEIWCWNTRMIKELYRQLEFHNATSISAATLEALRILESRPKFGQDITEKYLPQETAQTHALHFSKGCYLGQEIVERIHSRGQVHRTFTQFRLNGTLPETLPTPLESNAKPAGELTSAAQIGPDIYALGYIRRELLDTHAPLTYPTGSAAPTKV